jgi:hypothetical protein
MKTLNFKYEDGFKNKNKYFPAISMVQYLSNKTIRRPPQCHETIPLRMEKMVSTHVPYANATPSMQIYQSLSCYRRGHQM